MESPRKKMVVGDEGGDGGESSESVIVQCTEAGEVEQGEEVAMAIVESTPREGLLYCAGRRGSLAAALQACCDRAKLKEEEEVMEDVVSESDEVGSVRCVDRSVGDRKVIVVGVHDNGGCWRLSGARRRCRGRNDFMHGPFGDGASFVVDRDAAKRKHEEVSQFERPEVLEGDESDDDSASPSGSDASESESEQWKRRDVSSKRTRRGESVPQQLIPGVPNEPQASAGMHEEEEEEEEDYDYEVKKMQQLLEMQVKAAEEREAGMKQRMERMMDALSRHMGHVEDRVCNLEEERVHPQEQVLERITVKLEKVMEGFSALNENLATLSVWLSKNL